MRYYRGNNAFDACFNKPTIMEAIRVQGRSEECPAAAMQQETRKRDLV